MSKKEFLKDEVTGLLAQVKELIHSDEFDMRDEVHSKLWNEMVSKAVELHKIVKPKHRRYMIKNRGCSPDTDPFEFYNHVHPIEDLLAYIDDPHAKDDPEDQTIGKKFKMDIYSCRWGHTDLYHLERTKQGWKVFSNSSGGECDKSGKPFLFDILKNDLINYPKDLVGYLEWLWDQAQQQGLTHNEVQDALTELAEWINMCEKGSPGEIWEPYRFPGKTRGMKIFKEGAVTFLDVVGWVGIWTKRNDALLQLSFLVDFLKKEAKTITTQVISEHKRLSSEGSIHQSTKVLSISDTIVFLTTLDQNASLKIHGKLCQKAIIESLKKGIPLRGATSFGKFKDAGTILIGPAVDEAAAWHENLEWFGSVMTPSAFFLCCHDDMDCWVEYSVPTKTGCFETACVNWPPEFLPDSSVGYKRESLLKFFIDMGTITPAFSKKYENTLRFFDFLTNKRVEP